MRRSYLEDRQTNAGETSLDLQLHFFHDVLDSVLACHALLPNFGYFTRQTTKLVLDPAAKEAHERT